MRLAPQTVKAICEEVALLDPAAEVYLFGSRVRDDLKGGDIDLVVISERLRFSEKLTLLARIKSRIGEQKIDLKLVSAEEAKIDPFVVEVLVGAVRLKG